MQPPQLPQPAPLPLAPPPPSPALLAPAPLAAATITAHNPPTVRLTGLRAKDQEAMAATLTLTLGTPVYVTSHDSRRGWGIAVVPAAVHTSLFASHHQRQLQHPDGWELTLSSKNATGEPWRVGSSSLTDLPSRRPEHNQPAKRPKRSSLRPPSAGPRAYRGAPSTSTRAPVKDAPCVATCGPPTAPANDYCSLLTCRPQPALTPLYLLWRKHWHTTSPRHRQPAPPACCSPWRPHLRPYPEDRQRRHQSPTHRHRIRLASAAAPCCPRRCTRNAPCAAVVVS